MRFAHSVVFVCILLLAVPSWGKQPPQNAPTTQPASDPQAVALVQAAITALGGATAIGQSQSWDFQGVADGPLDNGNKTEAIKLQLVNATITVNGVSRRAPNVASPSLFLPVLAGTILLQESQDPNYIMRFEGSSTLASRAVIGVNVLTARTQSLAQTWLFDATTSLPARVFFDTPAQVRQTQTFRALIDLSNYIVVSGVLYPFSIVTYTEGRLPETLTLQTVTPSATSPSQGAQATGGVQ